MSRRSQRIRNTHRDDEHIVDAVTPETDSEFDEERQIKADSGFEAAASTQKSASSVVKNRTTRRKGGKLRQMLDMPLDVILEVRSRSLCLPCQLDLYGHRFRYALTCARKIC